MTYRSRICDTADHADCKDTECTCFCHALVPFDKPTNYCIVGIHECGNPLCICDCHKSKIPTHYNFSVDEIKAVYRLLEHEWIPHDDLEALAVVRKISEIIRKHELASRNNQST